MARLFLLACLVALVSAQCTLYFDDCGACLADPACGWCGDFCTSRDSSLCDVDLALDASACPAQDPSSQIVNRQSDDCAGRICSDCMAQDGCIICLTVSIGDNVVLSSACLSNSSVAQCVSGSYPTPGTRNEQGDVCQIPPGATVIFVIVIRGFPATSVVQAAIVAGFNSFIAGLSGRLSLTDANIWITDVQSGDALAKRAESLEMRQSEVTSYFFTPTSPDTRVYPTDTLYSDMDDFLNSLNGNLGGLQVEKVGRVDLGDNNQGGGGDDGNDLSDGELAGIIIACIIGTLILAAIIAFLLLRKRSHGYPAPFRSPAASFRP